MRTHKWIHCFRHHSRKWACNGNTKFDYYLLEKSFSHMNECTYIYICMKSSFPQQCYPNCPLPLQPQVLDWRLTHFGKELFKYQHLNKTKTNKKNSCTLTPFFDWDIGHLNCFHLISELVMFGGGGRRRCGKGRW